MAKKRRPARKPKVKRQDADRLSVKDRIFDLRDYFAGQALCGVMAATTGDETGVSAKMIAEWTYELADAMIAARTAELVEEQTNVTHTEETI